MAEFVAGRGASDLIWTLARHLDGKTTGLPMPAYTEFRRAFPQARPFGGGASTHPAEVLDEAMQACDAVIISNPHNPTGQVIQAADLAAVAARHPASLLVADESYIDFLADPAPITLIGCGLGNVIVLRSPSKFFGLAGARSGVAWSLHPLPRSMAAHANQLAGIRLRRRSAAHSPHQQRLGRQHTPAPGQRHRVARRGTDRYRAGDHARESCISGCSPGPPHAVTRFAGHLGSCGVAVRVLEEAYGVGKPAIRISAPRRQDQPTLSAALRACGKGHDRAAARRTAASTTHRAGNISAPAVPGQREARGCPGMGSVASRRQDALVTGYRLRVFRAHRA